MFLLRAPVKRVNMIDTCPWVNAAMRVGVRAGRVASWISLQLGLPVQGVETQENVVWMYTPHQPYKSLSHGFVPFQVLYFKSYFQ